MSSHRPRTAATLLLSATLALTACGGGDAGSSDASNDEATESDPSVTFDTGLIFATTTSEEVCDVVPTSEIVDLLGGDNVTGSAQIGSISCYLNGLGFPDIVIVNEETRDGLSDYASVIGEIGPTQFDTTELVSGVGDEALLATNENTQQLTIGIGDNTLTVKQLVFDSPPEYVGVGQLTAVARLLGVG